jgi:hypothetical protein
MSDEFSVMRFEYPIIEVNAYAKSLWINLGELRKFVAKCDGLSDDEILGVKGLDDISDRKDTFYVKQLSVMGRPAGVKAVKS